MQSGWGSWQCLPQDQLTVQLPPFIDLCGGKEEGVEEEGVEGRERTHFPCDETVIPKAPQSWMIRIIVHHDNLPHSKLRGRGRRV